MAETPTFQELLTSQEARDRAQRFHHDPDKCSHWMTVYGNLYQAGENPACVHAIWQGYLQEAAPPPEPRVFKRVEYRNIYKVEGIGNATFATRHDAALCGDMNGGCVGRVRVEITATEGQFDD